MNDVGRGLFLTLPVDGEVEWHSSGCREGTWQIDQRWLVHIGENNDQLNLWVYSKGTYIYLILLRIVNMDQTNDK